jgi:hypothetical protein
VPRDAGRSGVDLADVNRFDSGIVVHVYVPK